MKGKIFLCALLWFLLLPQELSAQQAAGAQGGLSNPVVLIIVLGALSLAPFLLIMLTSFVKIAVVLSILRNALGVQNIPPNPVITGLALILTIFIMAPVGQDVYKAIEPLRDTGKPMFSEATIRYLFEAAKLGKEPVRQFLVKHSYPKDRALFLELAKMSQSKRDLPSSVTAEDFQVVIPAFVISELKEAFQIGFIIFIPFLVIDMVVSNILLSMGMFMLSPVTVSIPFKLLLFVLVDGWHLIVKNLVLGYMK